MPQVDLLIFSSQLFWLVTIFLGFYLITLKFVLPRISARLKIRSKHLNYLNTQVNNTNAELDNAVKNHEKQLVTILSNCSSHVNKITTSSLEWIDNTYGSIINKIQSDINKTVLSDIVKERLKITKSILVLRYKNI